MCIVRLLLQSVVYVLTIALNVIPLLGTAIFFALNGALLAWGIHLTPYLATKKLSFIQQNSWVSAHASEYASFGSLALLLLSLPFLNAVFHWTNVIGAAEWVASMELAGEGIIPQTTSRGASNFIRLEPDEQYDDEDTSEGEEADSESDVPAVTAAETKCEEVEQV